MVVLSKQQKALTVSIGILYDDIYKKRNVTKKKKSEKIVGEKVVSRKKEFRIFSRTDKGTRTVRP